MFSLTVVTQITRKHRDVEHLSRAYQVRIASDHVFIFLIDLVPVVFCSVTVGTKRNGGEGITWLDGVGCARLNLDRWTSRDSWNVEHLPSTYQVRIATDYLLIRVIDHHVGGLRTVIVSTLCNTGEGVAWLHSVGCACLNVTRHGILPFFL